MLARLEGIRVRFGQINEKLTDPSVFGNQAEYQKLAKKRAELEPIIVAFEEYQGMNRRLDEAQQILATETDPELRAMAEDEQRQLRPVFEQREKKLKLLLVPKDPNDSRNTIVEIRAGTGGEEAALFAGSLYRMYTKYADSRRWRLEVMSLSDTGIGGIKEVIFQVNGDGAYGRLKYESGVHRVQRVPETEASGRIHTSAATVAVLPEAEEVDLTIDERDLRIDVFRSSGPGGQSVNTTDSAVRVTHIPTGIVISCQDEKSQHKNKAKAIKILRARLYDAEQDRLNRERAQARRSQVGSGDRSERIRTYNFPQQRVTDHRINFTLYRLTEVVEGDLDELIEKLIEEDNIKKLALGGDDEF